MPRPVAFDGYDEFRRAARGIKRTEGAVQPLHPPPGAVPLGSAVGEVDVVITDDDPRDDIMPEREGGGKVWAYPAKIVYRNYTKDSGGAPDWIVSDDAVWVFDLNYAEPEVGRYYRGWVYGLRTWTLPEAEWELDDELEPVDPGPISAVLVKIDSGVFASSWKRPVKVATTVAVTLTTGLEGGDTVDGVVLAAGDRILVKNQSSQAENGIYVVNTSGSPTRAVDADTGASLLGATVVVTNGTVNADTVWLCTANAVITVDTTALPWVKISSDLTVEEDDGSPSFPHTDTLQFNHLDGFVVDQPATGKARVSLPLLRTLTCFDFLADFDATATCNEDGTITLNITKYFKSASGYGIVISDTPCP